MLRWPADPSLNSLIRRYYAGEASLWEPIREAVDDELRRRGIETGRYHLRLISRSEGGYDILVEDAAGYEVYD